MLATIAAILSGCANSPAHSTVSTPAVETLGANSNFAKGDFGSYANLADFRHRRHVYAVGPVQHLGGEVTVIDSVPYAVQVDEDKLEVTSAVHVAAQARRWPACCCCSSGSTSASPRRGSSSLRRRTNSPSRSSVSPAISRRMQAWRFDRCC
jgi:hypothetical protein